MRAPDELPTFQLRLGESTTDYPRLSINCACIINRPLASVKNPGLEKAEGKPPLYPPKGGMGKPPLYPPKGGIGKRL